MLIVEAQNITGGSGERLSGFADYRVKVYINERPIWTGVVEEHFRDDGAGDLLIRIGTAMNHSPQGNKA